MGMALPIAVEKVDEVLRLREPLTPQEQAVKAMPSAEQNDKALAELSKMMGGMKR